MTKTHHILVVDLGMLAGGRVGLCGGRVVGARGEARPNTGGGLGTQEGGTINVNCLSLC